MATLTIGGRQKLARNTRIKALRYEKHWTLQKIAKKFRISRQRVFQIVTTA